MAGISLRSSWAVVNAERDSEDPITHPRIFNLARSQL